MTWLLIVLLLLVIVAPLFAILPSKAQKEKMRLRRQAMGMGISIELTRIPDPVPDQDKYRTATGRPLEPVLSVSAWRLARNRSGQEPSTRPDWVAVRGAVPGGDLPGNWRWEKPPPETADSRVLTFLQGTLQELPADVVRVEDSGNFTSVYWHESSGDEGFSAVTDFLVNYSQLLAGRNSEVA